MSRSSTNGSSGHHPAAIRGGGDRVNGDVGSRSGRVPEGGAATRPPAWPRTQRPLTIAILGWARLSSQAKEGSGYNLNASELARGLALMGHRVVYLSSGMSYRVGPLGGVGGPRIAVREAWAGIDCHELRNSPILSPAACNFGNLTAEVSNPIVTGLVLRWLEAQRVQVVHIHALEGFGFDLIPAIEQSGRRVVVTPHNYHFACPQVDLLHREREVCTDYDGGRKCEGCLKPGRTRSMRLTRAIGQTLEYRLGTYPADVIRKAAYGLPGFVKRLVSGRVSLRHPPPILNPDRHEDPEFAAGFQSADAQNRDGPEVIDSSQASLAPMSARSPLDQNERVLNNDKHLVVLNEYGRRRIAGLEALKAASLVTPPSDYLRRVHVAMGVPEDRTRWVRLGQPHFDEINRRARRSPFYDVRPWDPNTARRPLRFAFYGTTRPNKGLEVFARAIPLVAPELRARCQFVIHAAGDDAAIRRRLRGLAQVQVWPGYELAQLAAGFGEYDVGVLSHIWLENSPLVLLEHLHGGKFVLAPRLGGVVDFVHEPKHSMSERTPSVSERVVQRTTGPEVPVAEQSDRTALGNGLLFAGGDESGLARCIERLVTGEVVIPTAREVHEISTLRSYPEHVAEVDAIYASLLGEKPDVRVRVGRLQVSIATSSP